MDYGFENLPQSSIEASAFEPLATDAFETPTESSSSPSLDVSELKELFELSPPMNDATASYYSMEGMIPVEYVGSTSLDERDRCRRQSNSHKAPENLSSMHLRRRAQNRASQRAFRERKEKHVKALEDQLQCLHEQHQALLYSYTRQSEEVGRLKDVIKELMSELELLKTANNIAFSGIGSPDRPGVFDIPGQYPSTSYPHLSSPHYFTIPSSQSTR
ncbi:predicted protein [Uncinocarpus reesii 1704]|uniref:BZIP domain-containing protein n=1 Tax=Uncinocarpus reesii (strain UAMH 1704) TaxID=336963 RepID=C4JPR9_UNCRE|nr:uncharacterized protein UREG_04562 [Uncinocarpus reesii 1704]EEP79716.1 predicted protein [Uncinocarpus reesii 1704]